MPDSQQRILMVSQRLFPYVAGAELQALGLARALLRQDVEVEMLTTSFAKGLERREVVDGVCVRRIVTAPRVHAGAVPVSGALLPSIKVCQFLGMAIAVSRLAREFDVVHAHCLSMSSLGAACGARLAGVPAVVKPSLGGPDGEIQKFVTQPMAKPLLSVLRSVDAFACLDPGITDELVELGVERMRCVPVHNGIDLSRFSPPTQQQRALARSHLGLGDGPVALFVGQIIERKGIGALLAAWEQVRCAISGAMLLVAGTGHLSPAVEQAASDRSAGLTFLGVREDIHALMHAADMLVLPSHNESFGNVVVEAMASGLPVVVSRTGIASQLNIDPDAGRLVDPANPSSIGDAIVEVFRSAGRGVSLGLAGRQMVTRFDFDQIARDYREIYRTVGVK